MALAICFLLFPSLSVALIELGRGERRQNQNLPSLLVTDFALLDSGSTYDWQHGRQKAQSHCAGTIPLWPKSQFSRCLCAQRLLHRPCHSCLLLPPEHWHLGSSSGCFGVAQGNVTPLEIRYTIIIATLETVVTANLDSCRHLESWRICLSVATSQGYLLPLLS